MPKLPKFLPSCKGHPDVPVRPQIFRGLIESMVENGHEVGWRHENKTSTMVRKRMIYFSGDLPSILRAKINFGLSVRTGMYPEILTTLAKAQEIGQDHSPNK